jgi:heat shock protein HslJ
MRIRMIVRATIFIATWMLASCATIGWSGDTGALNGTGWTLSDLLGQSLLPDRQVTMHFENGRIHGTDGCNRYSATYTAEGGKLRLGQNIVYTRKACEEPVMQQAEAFLGALSKAGGFWRDARQLVLLDANGDALATLTKQRMELASSSWWVTAYNNGKQGVVNVLDGSELTVDFGGGGTMSGSAGCNSFTATYVTSGQGIKIGRVAATKKMCIRPRGVMEQEGQFLKALETSAVWLLDGDELELRTSRQSLAVTLSATKGPRAQP